MTYDAGLDESDTTEASEFIKSKVGDRWQAGHGTTKQASGTPQLELVDWSRLNYVRGRKILTVNRVGTAFVIFLIAWVAVIQYRMDTHNPDVNFMVTTGANGDCSHVSFTVRNMGFPTLHDWAANVSISPGASILVNPASVPLESLASGRTSSQHAFTISFVGVPEGMYQLKVNVLNGTRVVASSAPVTCNVLN
jgi:hypothetical protein